MWEKSALMLIGAPVGLAGSLYLSTLEACSGYVLGWVVVVDFNKTLPNLAAVFHHPRPGQYLSYPWGFRPQGTPFNDGALIPPFYCYVICVFKSTYNRIVEIKYISSTAMKFITTET